MKQDRKSLIKLKQAAEAALDTKLAWTDHPAFGGSACADWDGSTVSLMSCPPEGQPHAALIVGGEQKPLLLDEPEQNGDGWQDAVQLAMAFGKGDG